MIVVVVKEMCVALCAPCERRDEACHRHVGRFKASVRHGVRVEQDGVSVGEDIPTYFLPSSPRC